MLAIWAGELRREGARGASLGPSGPIGGVFGMARVCTGPCETGTLLRETALPGGMLSGACEDLEPLAGLGLADLDRLSRRRRRC